MKFDINLFVRPHLKTLLPYSSARAEFGGEASVFLDANENPLESILEKDFQRYPDPTSSKLKQKLSRYKSVDPENIFVGNGSDEAIDLLFRIFAIPGQSNAIICPPTYGMYEVSGRINDIEVRKAPLTEYFQPDEELIFKIADANTRLLFICSPNNPTGNLVERNLMLRIIENFKGIVVVDEAYIDFADSGSVTEMLTLFPNLVVLQTFSKSWGMAGLRLGVAYGSSELITWMNKFKPPYNINQASLEYGLRALERISWMKDNVSQIKVLRDNLVGQLKKLSIVTKVYPSDSNFVLARFNDADEVYAYLSSKGVVVRNRSKEYNCENCLRITVGTKKENERLVTLLSVLSDGSPEDIKTEFTIRKRAASVVRVTNETNISVDIFLDGTGKTSINTGLGFFDHMLEQVGKHGGIDLMIQTKGDLHIDEHHTVEDTALALGEAFLKALGDKKGIERYGYLLPMDDCLAQVALDFGGRPWLVWDVRFDREKIGDMPSELFEHFFKSFSDSSKSNLNIRAEGGNEHHKIESVFKAFARAIKMAVKKDLNNNSLPSTKGVL